jgi:hypothetical protein
MRRERVDTELEWVDMEREFVDTEWDCARSSSPFQTISNLMAQTL